MHTYNSGLFFVNCTSHILNSSISNGNHLLIAFSSSLQNKSASKLTFLRTVLVYSNIALAILYILNVRTVILVTYYKNYTNIL